MIGALRVTLGLDTAQFEAGTKRARGIAQRDASAIQKTLSGIKGSLNGLVATATISALTAATKRALDFAGGLGEVAQQLGVTTRDLQVYRYIASQVGVEQDTMDASLAKLTRSMGQAANGSKQQAEAFRDLGVAVEDQNGKLYTAGEILPRLADAFARIKDPATRARLEAELFGRAGQKLDPLLTQGAKGVEELTRRAEELGLVLGDDLIDSADRASDRLAEMQKQLEVSFARAVANSADAIVGLANAFATLTSQALNFINKYPQLVGALAGAAAGARMGGPWGAAAGGAIGFLGGDAFAKSQRDANMDRKFRRTELQKAIDNYRNTRGIGRGGQVIGPAGNVPATAAAKAAEEEMNRQWGLYQQARTATSAASPSAIAPQGDLPTARGGGRKPPRDRTQDYLERYERELAGLLDDELSAQSRMVIDVMARTDLEKKRLDTEQAAYEHDVDNRVKAEELTQAQGERLKLAKQTVLDAERALVDQRKAEELLREERDAQEAAFDLRDRELRGDMEEARTSADRRRVGLRLLDLQYEREKAQLQEVLALRDLGLATEEQARLAQEQLDRLAGLKASDAKQVRRDTMGPLESYLDQLPRTATELNEAFERVASDGLQSLNDGLVEAIMGARSLGDVFKNVANQIVSDLLRIAIQKNITGPLANALFGGGFMSSLGGLFGGGVPLNLPRLAGGGSMMVGGIGGVDRNVLSIGGVPRAMVSADERLHVTPSNDNGGKAPIVFDMRGAVVTEDLLAQMNAIAGVRSDAAVMNERVRGMRQAGRNLARWRR